MANSNISWGGTGPIGATAVAVTGEEPEEEQMMWSKEIEVDDLELVKKEWWLLGYWVKEMHPGHFEVYKEPDDPMYHPVHVASYTKPWNSKKWKLAYPGEQEDDG